MNTYKNMPALSAELVGGDSMAFRRRRVPGSTTRRSVQGKVSWTVLAVVLALLVGAGLWWRHAHEKADSGGDAASSASAASGGGAGRAGGQGGRRFGGGSNVQAVSVQAARVQDIRVTVTAIGIISASNTAVVRPQVSGVLQALHFEEGQQVKAGQVLAQIDPRSFQATLTQAEGNLARDKASLDNARLDLARDRELLSRDAVAQQQVQTQESLVKQLEGTVKADQGAVDSARLQVSYTKVTAPISGRVGLRQADLGNVVSTTDTNGLVTITQTQPVSLVFAVPSANLPTISARLRARQPLPVEAWDRGETTSLATGRVVSADNLIDTGTDTIKLKASFPNVDDALFPNQAVSVKLQLDLLKDVLAVPQAAVLRGAQGFYVYVAHEDNTVSMRTVQTGAVDNGWMMIKGDVQPGDRVVIDGVDRLRDGAKVNVIAADPKQRAGAQAAKRGGRGASGAHGASGAASGRAGGWAASGASKPAVPRGDAASADGEERPRWLDRLPPDVAEKVMKMSPEERRAWIEQRRQERARQQGDSAASK